MYASRSCVCADVCARVKLPLAAQVVTAGRGLDAHARCASNRIKESAVGEGACGRAPLGVKH